MRNHAEIYAYERDLRKQVRRGYPCPNRQECHGSAGRPRSPGDGGSRRERAGASDRENRQSGGSRRPPCHRHRGRDSPLRSVFCDGCRHDASGHDARTDVGSGCVRRFEGACARHEEPHRCQSRGQHGEKRPGGDGSRRTHSACRRSVSSSAGGECRVYPAG